MKKLVIMRMTMILCFLALSFLVLNTQKAIYAEGETVEVTTVTNITEVTASATNLNMYYYDSTADKYYQCREVSDGETTTYQMIECTNPTPSVPVPGTETPSTSDTTADDKKPWYENIWVLIFGGILLGLIFRKLIK